jgi:hypothetical protein
MHRATRRLASVAAGAFAGGSYFAAAAPHASRADEITAAADSSSSPSSSSPSSSPPPLYAPIPVVGGHAGMLGNGDHVLKPCVGPRGQAEADFYRRVFDPSRGLADPVRFLPHFLGTTTTTAAPAPATASAPSSYLVLEDLARPYRRPSVMDLKVGVQTWDENAPVAKVEQERAKWPPQQVVGFRFTGMRVWDAVHGGFREHGRAFGYALDESTLDRAFAEYLSDGRGGIRRELIPPFLARLREIEGYFARQNEFRFYGSSLLFLYEGDAATGPRRPSSHEHQHHQASSSSSSSAPPPSPPPLPVVDVRMIDFAHVWPIRDGPEGRDDGYLTGVRSIMRYLEQVEKSGAQAGDGATTETITGGAGA